MRGGIGFESTASHYNSSNAGGGLNVAVTRRIGIFTDYSFYRYDVPAGSTVFTVAAEILPAVCHRGAHPLGAPYFREEVCQVIPGKRYTPELVLSIAWRRKWLIVIPTVLVAVLGCAITYFLPDLYRSEAAILVVPPRVSENYVRSNVTTKIEDRLRSINQQVRSRTKLERIIEDLNLYPERRKTDIMQDIVDDMSKAIDVDIVQGDVFKSRVHVRQPPDRACR